MTNLRLVIMSCPETGEKVKITFAFNKLYVRPLEASSTKATEATKEWCTKHDSLSFNTPKSAAKYMRSQMEASENEADGIEHGR